MRLLLVLAACLQLAACGGDSTPEGLPGSAGSQPSAAAMPEPAAPGEAPASADERGAEGPGLLEQELAYGAAANRNLVGFFALPEDVIEPLPAVILVPDWWGLRDQVKDVAREVAREGYAVLAVDLFAGAAPTTAAEAEQLMTDTLRNPDASLANLRQAYDYLDRYALAPRIAMLGWHVGGYWALESALAMGGELDGAVIYYGDVETDASRLGELEVPLLGLFAENDATVPVRKVQNFRNALRELGKPADIYIYSNVRHGFADPTASAYNAAAAAEAWQATLAFLEARLKPAN